MMRSMVEGAEDVWSVPNTSAPFRPFRWRSTPFRGHAFRRAGRCPDLAQGRAEGALERVGVLAHLALVDETLLVRVHELDRVFDGDKDVRVAAGAVDVVDERRERRALAGNRWAP